MAMKDIRISRFRHDNNADQREKQQLAAVHAKRWYCEMGAAKRVPTSN